MIYKALINKDNFRNLKDLKNKSYVVLLYDTNNAEFKKAHNILKPKLAKTFNWIFYYIVEKNELIKTIYDNNLRYYTIYKCNFESTRYEKIREKVINDPALLDFSYCADINNL